MSLAEHLILSQVFSRQTLLQGRGSQILHVGDLWHPVGSETDRTAAQGQPSTVPVRARCGYVPGLSCGSCWGRSPGCNTLPAPA
jgi:hypothetical protein